MKMSVCSIVILMTVAGSVGGAGLDDLMPLMGWNEKAAGVWQASIGDVTQEVRYTDLAAQAPRLEALKALPQTKIPPK